MSSTSTRTTTITATAGGPTQPILISGPGTFGPGATGLEARYLVPPSVIVPTSNDGFTGTVQLQVTADQPDASGNWNPINWAPFYPPNQSQGYSWFAPLPALVTGIRGFVTNYNAGTATVQVVQ